MEGKKVEKISRELLKSINPNDFKAIQMKNGSILEFSDYKKPCSCGCPCHSAYDQSAFTSSQPKHSCIYCESKTKKATPPPSLKPESQEQDIQTNLRATTGSNLKKDMCSTCLQSIEQQQQQNQPRLSTCSCCHKTFQTQLITCSCCNKTFEKEEEVQPEVQPPEEETNVKISTCSCCQKPFVQEVNPFPQGGEPEEKTFGQQTVLRAGRPTAPTQSTTKTVLRAIPANQTVLRASRPSNVSNPTVLRASRQSNANNPNTLRESKHLFRKVDTTSKTSEYPFSQNLRTTRTTKICNCNQERHICSSCHGEF